MSQATNVCVQGDWGSILPMVTSDLDMHVHMYAHAPAHANVFRRTTPTFKRCTTTACLTYFYRIQRGRDSFQTGSLPPLVLKTLRALRPVRPLDFVCGYDGCTPLTCCTSFSKNGPHSCNLWPQDA